MPGVATTSVRRCVGHCLLMALVATGVAVAGTGPVPTPIGVGPRFHPAPTNHLVDHGLPVGRLNCTATGRERVGVHLELFARGRVVMVPAGIGIAPPLHRNGVYVVAGRCSYAARTREPTGVIEVDQTKATTLGDLFTIWGRPLTARRLLAFTAHVRAYVNGRRRYGDPRSIPLRRHAEIVLEVGPVIPPHAAYRFPKGL